MSTAAVASVPRLPLDKLREEKKQHRKPRRRSRALGTIGGTSPLSSGNKKKEAIEQEDQARPATATSAPTGGRERAHEAKPPCPNCGHRRAVQKLCYWDVHQEWVYTCAYEGLASDDVLRTPEQVKARLHQLVDAQFGIQPSDDSFRSVPSLLLGTETSSSNSSQSNSTNTSHRSNNNDDVASDPDKPLSNARFMRLEIAPPLALTHSHDKVKFYFCGYRWRPNRKLAMCDGCLRPLVIDMHANEPKYWCRVCEDFSC